jgi:hypothetical protein
MKPVELTAEAELDAFEIAHHYEREREGSGNQIDLAEICASRP